MAQSFNRALSRTTGYRVVRANQPPRPTGSKAGTGPRTAAGKKLVPPTSPPGSCRVEPFFDQYPRFYETSQTGNVAGRLNQRHHAIFTQNADIFPGARVLDIVSHDGRYSLAALKSGASHVLGIEGRP